MSVYVCGRVGFDLCNVRVCDCEKSEEALSDDDGGKNVNCEVGTRRMVNCCESVSLHRKCWVSSALVVILAGEDSNDRGIEGVSSTSSCEGLNCFACRDLSRGI